MRLICLYDNQRNATRERGGWREGERDGEKGRGMERGGEQLIFRQTESEVVYERGGGERGSFLQCRSINTRLYTIRTSISGLSHAHSSWGRPPYVLYSTTVQYGHVRGEKGEGPGNPESRDVRRKYAG